MAYSIKTLLIIFSAFWLYGCGAKSEEETTDTTLQNAQTFYNANIAQPVVQARCVVCHVSGGLAGHTRLVFSAGASQQVQNLNVFKNFLSSVNNGEQLILDKVVGLESHSGGEVFKSTSNEFKNIKTLFELLNVTVTEPPAAQSFFDKVTLEPTDKTLRRASLLFAARLPTPAEISQAAASPEAFKTTLTQIMQGEAFHEFLVRSANDKLLTDAFINDLFLEVFTPNDPQYPLLVDKKHNNTKPEFDKWMQRARYGITRAPLELIAYVVENNRPYTEVLTADYTMVNPQTNEVLNAGAVFDNDDPLKFKPGKNNGQILRDAQYQAEYSEDLGLNIISHSPPINYPHAGLLNEPAFLNRYPTTDTNRNRARSRWTYLHFLGVDIEKSAGRTTDPVALADTNNPTMNNPACTICHATMDPVAGAFQNYGDEGWYRSSWGGLDALPDSYKKTKSNNYVKGETWFKDMRTPGFAGSVAPNANNSLQWLAQQITQDDRFASATVKFWWESIMSEALLLPPENSSDANYSSLLAAYNAQQTVIDDLAKNFKKDYQLKSLFAAMVASPWFSAGGRSTQLSDARLLELIAVGNGRLLTPAELEAKTKSLLGIIWGGRTASWMVKNSSTALADRYNIYYGGIDSVGIVKRAKEINSLMSNVAEAQAVSIACPTVVLDMNHPTGQQKLFTAVDRFITPTLFARNSSSVTGTNSTATSTHSLSHYLPAGSHRLKLAFTNPYWDATLKQGTNLVLHTITVTNAAGTVLQTINAKDINTMTGAVIATGTDGKNTSGQNWDATIKAITGWVLWSDYVDLPLTVANAGIIKVTVTASRKNLPERDVFLGISFNSVSPNANSDGEKALRTQLQLFHQRLLGETLALNSEELNQSYALLVELWQQRKTLKYRTSAIAWDYETCDMNITDWWSENRDKELNDPDYMQGTWMSMMVYFLTDYYYLHE